jgi:hypothetical protein
MSRGRKKEIPLNQPASLVLFSYGGRTVWMEPEKAAAFAQRLRKRGHKVCLVHRKVKP